MIQTKGTYFSIIVPVFNRVFEVNELLQSIEKLDFPRENFEVIISDDGSTDNLNEIVDSFKKKKSFKLIHLIQQNKGPGAARNLGVSKASGDFFIFVDSDVIIPSDWLKNISAALKKENADAFGGPDTYSSDFDPFLKAVNYSMTSFLTTGGLRGKKGKKLAKFYPRSFNMGLSRKTWEKTGGFGSLRHGQDIEFSNRIIKSGAKIIFINNAPVYHKRRTSLRRFYKQVFNWGVARINLYKIDPAMLEPLHALPAVITLIFFSTIFLAFFFEFFFYVFIIGAAFVLILILLSMLDAARIYKSLKPSVFLPLVMPAQIIGYGLGFIYNFIRRVIFYKDEKTGFQKNYYK